MEERRSYQTFEFWLSLLAGIAGFLLASGLIGSGTPAETILGTISAALSTLGYTGFRSFKKSADNRSIAMATAATAIADSPDPS